MKIIYEIELPNALLSKYVRFLRIRHPKIGAWSWQECVLEFDAESDEPHHTRGKQTEIETRLVSTCRGV